MGKFNDLVFFSNWDALQFYAVSKIKYTKDEAEKMAKTEIGENIFIGEQYVRYGFGRDDEDEKRNGWWLESIKPKGGSCPVWVFEKV